MGNRVLLLVKGLGRGGAERLLVDSTRHVDGERFSYEVAYLLAGKDALVDDLRAMGLPVHCLDAQRGFGWVPRLRSLIEQHGFGLVHAHSPLPAVGLRLACLRRSGVRIVYTEHNVWERYHPATYWANALTYARNDHVFAVSERVRSSIRYPAALRFLPMPSVETRYYGIDPLHIGGAATSDSVRQELGILPDAPVVGTVANFKPGKAHLDLLAAVVRVRAMLPDVRFVLVGTGPLEPVVRKRAQELGLDGTVIFAGYRDDVPRLMRAFDVLAVPSTHDGLSIALLEAMCIGTPPVITQVGGNPEVVRDGEHGLVVPPADPGAFAGALVRLLGDEELRSRLGEASRRRAATFDIREAIRRTEDIYGHLLEGSASNHEMARRVGGIT